MTQTIERPEAVDRAEASGESLWVYFALGIFLGACFIKSEVASWFRIQEMFRFQAVHMYGVIFSAILVGGASIALMKQFGTRTVRGEAISFPSRADARPQKHHILGGTVFGLGWGLVGACPGPFFALVGSGLPIVLVALLSAVGGAWVYGLLRPRLPH